VILSGAWWDSGVTPFEPSLYVSELADGGIVSREGWVARPETNPSAEAPPLGAPWPPEATLASREILALAAEVAEAVSRGPSGDVEALPHGREIAAMLAEQASRSGRASTVAMPTHLSATDLVSLSRNVDAFARDLRRPIPEEPTEAAARGSAFHGWVEAYYGAVSLWDDEDPGEPSGDAGALRDAFLASPWAARMPLATEARVEVPLGTITLRSQIDAVFPAGGGLGRVTVVDWKTGAPPKDAEERAAREVQLATYRLAWSRWKAIPIEDVDAVFFYASTGETVAPEHMLGEEEIVALVEAAGR